MKVKDLIRSLVEMDQEATVQVKVEVARNWEVYTEWADIEDIDDDGDRVRLHGD